MKAKNLNEVFENAIDFVWDLMEEITMVVLTIGAVVLFFCMICLIIIFFINLIK
jgi:type II secretory pathway component PulF